MGNLLIKILDVLVRITQHALFPFAAGIAFFWGLYDTGQELVKDVWAAVLEIEIPNTDFKVVDGYVPLARINRFIPLYEASLMAVAYYGAAAVVITFRWVKSFIPTLSN